MSGRRSLLLLAGGLLWAAAAAAPAAADWLVLRDGSRLETAGPWKAKGRLAVFELPDGTLSSVRLDQVDVEASAEATRRAAELARQEAETKKGPAPARKPVRSLTDSDFRRAVPAPAEAPGETGAEGEAAAGDAAVTPGGVASDQLVVSGWDQETTEDVGLAITGTISNRGQELATDVTLEVVLFDVTGERIAQAPATLDRTAIPAGGETAFRIAFPGVFGLTSAKFNITFRGFEKRPEPPPPAPGEGVT